MHLEFSSEQFNNTMKLIIGFLALIIENSQTWMEFSGLLEGLSLECSSLLDFSVTF